MVGLRVCEVLNQGIRADEPPNTGIIVPGTIVVQAGARVQSLAGEFLVRIDGAAPGSPERVERHAAIEASAGVRHPEAFEVQAGHRV